MMNEAVDRRMWSTTARGLSEFVADLQRLGIGSSSVRALQKTFKERGIYPARDFAHRCKAAPPDAFLTYHSAQNFVEIQEIVWKAFDFAADQLRARHPDLRAVDLESMIADGIRLWVDFLFIDQGARDLRKELDALPLLLEGASAHFVVGGLPLTRAWCCYEIALYNQCCATAGEQLLRSLIAPSKHIYFGWQDVETSDPADKLFIGDHIVTRFPNGFEGFNSVMQQANATAVLPLTAGSIWYTPAALDALGEAAELWYARTLQK
jgi:hypothetical protein